MKIAFVVRSTIHTIPGGDTVQVMQTARHLRKLGLEIDILLTGQSINYDSYDAFHFFNLIRPSDILPHLRHVDRPIFLTPILIDYSEFERHHRKGLSGSLLKLFGRDGQEYIKTIGRWVSGTDRLPFLRYVVKGHGHSVKSILNRASMLLPNSQSELEVLQKRYKVNIPHQIVPNGVDPEIFNIDNADPESQERRSSTNVLCVARIEGIKNQLNLIKAVNGSEFNLTLIGKGAPNQRSYYAECRKIARNNIRFIDHLPQEALAEYYRDAGVHVLPSWFETCGLSSLEAVAMGCRIVITDKGYTRDYFGEDAYYCDPGNPDSILSAIRKAVLHFQPSTSVNALQKKILANYTWPKAAQATLTAYKTVIQ